MPGRKSRKKGSFDGDLEELVSVFKTGPRSHSDGREDEPPADDGATVHDRLFESAWRRASKNGEADRQA